MTTPSGPRVVIFGASGHGKVVADALLAAGRAVDGFLDDDDRKHGSKLMGLPVLGGRSWLAENRAVAVALGVGANDARAKVASVIEELGLELVTVIHPTAIVARSASIDRGAVVLARSVVNADARVERCAILNTGAIVEHDCVVGEFAHVSPSASMGGGSRVLAFAQCGIGAILLPGVTVGRNTIVGAGATVTRDLPASVVAMGTPARSVRAR